MRGPGNKIHHEFLSPPEMEFFNRIGREATLVGKLKERPLYDQAVGFWISACHSATRLTMALSEHERYRFEKPIKAYIEARRPPPHIRPELDIGYRFSNQSIVLFEVRPAFKHPDETIEHPIAKATYVKSTNTWKIYWMRADLKWHRYEPQAIVSKVEEFIAEVDRDPYGCFFG